MWSKITRPFENWSISHQICLYILNLRRRGNGNEIKGSTNFPSRAKMENTMKTFLLASNLENRVKPTKTPCKKNILLYYQFIEFFLYSHLVKLQVCFWHVLGNGGFWHLHQKYNLYIVDVPKVILTSSTFCFLWEASYIIILWWIYY